MKKNTFLLLVLCCAFSGGSAFAAETSPLPQTGGKKSRYARPHEAGIRILTYNIRNCRGMDGKVDFDRIAGVIDSINPDYVALQEVDRHTSVMIIDYEAGQSEKPVILAGDFNDTPGSRTLDLLSQNWLQLSADDHTFRSDQPTRCIDYIFGLETERIHYEILQQVVVEEPVASDHLPVLVDVMIKDHRDQALGRDTPVP